MVRYYSMKLIDVTTEFSYFWNKYIYIFIFLFHSKSYSLLKSGQSHLYLLIIKYLSLQLEKIKIYYFSSGFHKKKSPKIHWKSKNGHIYESFIMVPYN